MTRLSNSSRHSHINAGAGGHLQTRSRVLFYRQTASHNIEVKAQFLTLLGNPARRPSGKIRDGYQGTIAQNHHAGGNVPDIGNSLRSSSGRRPVGKRCWLYGCCGSSEGFLIRRKGSQEVVLFLVRRLQGLRGYDVRPSGGIILRNIQITKSLLCDGSEYWSCHFCPVVCSHRRIDDHQNSHRRVCSGSKADK